MLEGFHGLRHGRLVIGCAAPTGVPASSAGAITTVERMIIRVILPSSMRES
jgi:hypothetical protein